jgi:hypothetical protein
MSYKYENCNLEIVWYIPVIPAPYPVRDKLQQESRSFYNMPLWIPVCTGTTE